MGANSGQMNEDRLHPYCQRRNCSL